MATFKWSPKDPSDVLDYVFDWGSTNLEESKRFLPAGETILTYTVTVPAGLTKVSDALTYSGKGVTFRVSGGSAGTDYNVTCLINTSSTETFEVTKPLLVRERVSPT